MGMEDIIRWAHLGLRNGNVDAAYKLLDDCVREMDRRKAEADKPTKPEPAAEEGDRGTT